MRLPESEWLCISPSSLGMNDKSMTQCELPCARWPEYKNNCVHSLSNPVRTNPARRTCGWQHYQHAVWIAIRMAFSAESRAEEAPVSTPGARFSLGLKCGRRGHAHGSGGSGPVKTSSFLGAGDRTMRAPPGASSSPRGVSVFLNDLPA